MHFKKFNTLKSDVIFIDGISGTGKSLISPVISGMTGVEKQKLEEVFPDICILHKYGKITDDACSFLINKYTDLYQYNSLIGREVNLRWGDDSGIKNNPDVWKYFTRLFAKEGSQVIKKINNENLALNILSNDIILADNLLFKTLKNRMKMIEMVRHPLYMVAHWTSFFSRFDQTRIFNLSTEYKGSKLPWFILDNQDKFLLLNNTEKAIYSIHFLYEELFTKLDNHKYRDQILLLTFEECCMDTKRILKTLEDFLGRKHSNRLSSILKKQKLPREQINQGKGLKKYGFKISTFKTEECQYNSLMSSYENDVSTDTIAKLLHCIDRYNKNFPSILSNFG
jgi:hypothetical protein